MSVIGFLASFNVQVEESGAEGPLLLELTDVELCLNSMHLPGCMCSIKS